MNLTIVNEILTQTNPTIQPSNYTQSNINPMNYNFNQQHQYDVAKKIHQTILKLMYTTLMQILNQ